MRAEAPARLTGRAVQRAGTEWNWPKTNAVVATFSDLGLSCAATSSLSSLCPASRDWSLSPALGLILGTLSTLLFQGGRLELAKMQTLNHQN